MAESVASSKVDFFPASAAERDYRLLEKVGCEICPPFVNSEKGAPTAAFGKAEHYDAAPLSGAGCFRVGESGKLFLIGKSEHYHASLGHAFPGYALLEQAKLLGIPNATHNNTRGYITRLCEKSLIAAANGVSPDGAEIDDIISSEAPHILNRVINLETGSVAAEAGIKMMLARFYRFDGTYKSPKYEGRTPVFFVMADDNGGPEANYHGTSVVAQTFRGLWPELGKTAEESGAYKVVPVRINDIADFKEKAAVYNSGKYKTAGFLHELVLMNFGGIRLTDEFIKEAYRVCRETDTPTMCDEIQSCMWYGGMFLFRKYGLDPDFVIIGKGFPGGNYPASRILTTAEMDTLPQFGALVTNGQEELASLSYLITMRFALDNAGFIDEMGRFFEDGLRRIGAAHPTLIARIEGQGHLGAIHFNSVEVAAAAAGRINARSVDTSAQLYKPHCPPAILFKPPLIADREVIGFMLKVLEEALSELDGELGAKGSDKI